MVGFGIQNRFLYVVDNWFRDHSGDKKLAVAGKGILGKNVILSQVPR